MGGHAIEPNTITGGLNTCGARPCTPSCNLHSPPPLQCQHRCYAPAKPIRGYAKGEIPVFLGCPDVDPMHSPKIGYSCCI